MAVDTRTTYRKKLIEVALPLAAINEEAAREKSIRHGHPSTLHLWWARRPLAACRAVLFAQLVNDPDDDPMYGVSDQMAATERAKLFDLIEELVKWENSNNPDVIRRARLEIARSIAANNVADGLWEDDLDLVAEARRQETEAQKKRGQDNDNPTPDAHLTPHSSPLTPIPPYTPYDVRFKMPYLKPEQIDHFLYHFAPPVLDPFCGGGSIPLEAQRLGLRAHASDLNPVPVLITKALIEIPPKFAGLPPVNPAARSKLRSESTGVRSETDALSRDGTLAKGNAGGEGSVPAGSATAEGRDLRDEIADHASSGINTGQHRGGLDPGDGQGQGSLSGDRPGLAGGDRDTVDSVRGTEVVSDDGNTDASVAVGRSKSDADVNAQKTKKRLTNTSHSSLLSAHFSPHSYRGAKGLAEDVRYYGQWMRDEAEKRIGHLYPKVKITQAMIDDGRPDLEPYKDQELTVIAWIWARTVASPDPSVGGKHVPLVRSFWLSKKKGKEAYVRPIIDRQKGTYEFKVHVGKPTDGFDPDDGTLITRKGGQCLLTKQPMPFTYLREQGKAHQMGERMLAIVCEGVRGRVYIDPIPEHAWVATSLEAPWRPDCEFPKKHRNFQTPVYGMDNLGDIFTPRQLTALVTFSDLVKEARERVLADARERSEELGVSSERAKNGHLTPHSSSLSPRFDPQAYADAVATYLAFVVNKMADLGNALNRWEPNAQCPRQLFARQAIPMVWDFAEGNPFSESSGSWEVLLRNLSNAFASPLFDFDRQRGAAAIQMDATATATYTANPIVSTDPPYYDNIGYADLSDFFYVWLRRSLGDVYPELFATLLTPKAEELIASPYRHKGNKQKAAEFFESGLGAAIGQWRKHGNPNYPTTIFYAFKQAETDTRGRASTGWETFLTGVIDHGFTITGTWPMRTEMGSRMVGQGTNALASSVVLVCVPRSEDAPLATRREFLNALKRELPDALRNLQSGNIAPVDLAQAAIGPGMAVFSRYAKVVEADGEPMTVRTALTLINQVLDEVLAEQEGEFDADTRWAVAWFEQYGMDEGPFGVAETLSKAKNTSVEGLVEAGVVRSRGGKVQLLGRDALPDDWDPTTDGRLTEWEAVQHLIRALDQQGETGAADLLRKLGGDYGERARDLAYRLYNICERKGWASEAIAYNSLVLAWPEISKLSRSQKTRRETHGELFEE